MPELAAACRKRDLGGDPGRGLRLHHASEKGLGQDHRSSPGPAQQGRDFRLGEGPLGNQERKRLEAVLQGRGEQVRAFEERAALPFPEPAVAAQLRPSLDPRVVAGVQYGAQLSNRSGVPAKCTRTGSKLRR